MTSTTAQIETAQTLINNMPEKCQPRLWTAKDASGEPKGPVRIYLRGGDWGYAQIVNGGINIERIKRQAYQNVKEICASLNIAIRY